MALIAILFSLGLQVHAIGLTEYVQKSVEFSSAVDGQARTLQNARDELTNNQRYYLPRLDLQSTIGKQEGNPAYPNQPDISNLSLGLSSTLYDRGDSINRWRQSEEKVQQAQLLYDKARDTLALDAARRFLNYSKLKLLDDIQRQTADTLEKEASRVSGEYQQGLRTRRDYLRFQGQLRRSSLTLVQSRLSIDQARSALVELWTDLPAVELDIERPKLHEQHPPIVPIAYQDHRDLKIVKYNQEIRQYDYDINHQRLWPTFGVTTAYNYLAQDFTTPRPTATEGDGHNWNLLLTMNWNIFDWGVRDRQNAILLNSNRISDDADEITLRALRKELLDLASRSDQIRQSLTLSSELLQMEESNYRVLEQEYREGKSTYLDLITELSDLTDARTQQLGAQFDWLDAHYEALYHEGRIYEHFLH